MKKVFFSAVIYLSFIVSSFAQQTCSTAQTITAGTHIIQSVNGTQVPNIVCATGGDGATAANWYKYTAPSNLSITVTTDFPSINTVDNRVHIYSGTCNNLICVAGDDDSGTNFLCVVTFNASANTDYYIVFDDKWSNAGFTFELIEENIVINPEIVEFTPSNMPTITGDYKYAVADMNGDYLDDIVTVSQGSLQIHHQQNDGSFTNINHIVYAQFLPTWSIAIGDFNKDGFNDLLYGGGQGVSFVRSINSGTSYATNTEMSQYVFSQRSNFIDINNDGNLDAFVCHDVAPNVYYLNDGDGNLSFNQGGMGDHPNGGNYGSIWVDYNNDGLPDLFIAKCRGGFNTAKINELFRNNGDGTFTNVSVESNLADPVQTWSSAWNDFDNDGWMDVVVGASSNTDGMHKYLRNNGDGTFENITSGSGFDTYTGLNIEFVSYDFNNDGFADVFTNNTILYNNGNNTFTPHNYSVLVGAIGDLNNDGFLDIQNGSTIHYNNGNSNNWFAVTLEGNQSNRNGIGARVELYGSWGKQIRDVRSGIGFKHMGTLNTHFGIGTASEIDSLIIKWPSGIKDVFCNPQINQYFHVSENSTPSIIAEFTVSENIISVNESVEFTDESSPCPQNWSWTVEPTTGWEFSNSTNSNSQNPVITFNQAGTYNVNLTSSNMYSSSTNESTQTIIVNSTLNIETDLPFEQMMIYPNPADNLIHLSKNFSDFKSYQVVSIHGSLLNVEINSTNNTIDISNLSSGTYFLSLTTEDDLNVSIRFIKR